MNNVPTQDKYLSESWDLCKLISKNVRYLLKKRGLTIQAMARGCSDECHRFPRLWLADVDRGHIKTVSSRRLIRISAFFGVPANYLLSVDLAEEEKKG